MRGFYWPLVHSFLGITETHSADRFGRMGPFSLIDGEDGSRIIRGYDASILVAACNIWLKAREGWRTTEQQLAKAQKAEMLLLAH